MPKVLNKYKEGFPAGSVYIGRPSAFGNFTEIGIIPSDRMKIEACLQTVED